MENNYTVLLDAAIAKHSLRAVWGDGLFERTEEARQERVDAKYKIAKRTFGAMMWSSKNDGSLAYQNWALDRALGITPTRASYRKALDGRIRSH